MNDEDIELVPHAPITGDSGTVAMGDRPICVESGAPAFNLHNNVTNYFHLGVPHGDDAWLKGEIVGPEQEFIFNARFFTSQGDAGTIFDNFPKNEVPSGWTKRPRMDGEGFDLVDRHGDTIFGYKVDDNRVCHVTVNLHKADRSAAAHGGQGGLVVHMPFQLGRYDR